MISRAMGWLTLFLIGTDLFVMSPLLPSITRELDVPAADGGWAVTTFAAAYLVGGPSFGSLADRTSRSRVLGIGLAVFALANLATALVDSFAALLAVRALAGLAASGVTPSVYALVSSAAPPAKRAMWLAVVTSGLLTALISGAPAGTLMADAVGWRGVFVVMAIASALILGVIWASAVRTRHPAAAVGASGPPPEPDAKATPPPPPPPATASILLRLRAVSVTTLWALAVYGIYTYLGTILTNIAHMTSGLLAAALACFGLGAIVGNLAGGRLTDRWGGRTVSIVSLSALAVLNTALGLDARRPGRRAPARPCVRRARRIPLLLRPAGPAHRLPASGQRVADRLEQQCDVRGHPHRVSPRGQGPDPPGRACARFRGRRRRRPRRPGRHPQHPRPAPHRVERRNVIRSRMPRHPCRRPHLRRNLHATPAARRLSRAAHFAGELATARFSSSSCRC